MPTAHALVDANIAKSASFKGGSGVARACYRVACVLSDRNCPTGIALTPTLLQEWERHANRMMSTWLANMESRGRLRREPDRRVNDLRVAIDAETDKGIRDALRTDVHLSEAALFHRLPVLSRDGRQRGFLTSLSSTYVLAGTIRWCDPVAQAGWESWVRDGCPPGSFEIATS